MSAWMCSDKHISALANAMSTEGIFPDMSDESIFNMLVTQNKTSLDARYGDADDMYDAINAYDPTAMFASDIEAVKNCHCYAYQSCEDDGWSMSDARLATDRLEAALLNRMGTTYEALRDTPEFNCAAWGIE